MKKVDEVFTDCPRDCDRTRCSVLVLVLTDPNRGEEEESSAVEDTSITLNEREEAELASMEVTFRDNEAGSYTLLSVEPADDSEDISFTVEGLEELSLSTSTLNSVASFGYGLTATRDLGTLENPAEYGLDDPQVSVLVTFTDGSTFSYDIGNETPTSGYYVKTGDSDSLYICTLGANIFKQKLEMVDDTILSITPPESEESSSSTTGTATNTYNSLTLSGKNFEEPVEIIYEPDSTLMSTYRMVSPSEVGCDDEKDFRHHGLFGFPQRGGGCGGLSDRRGFSGLWA